jgi:rRNA maturation protein Nop10
MSVVSTNAALRRRCREVLAKALAKAYTLNMKHPECGFVIPLYRPTNFRDVRDVKLVFRTVEECIAKVWPFFSYRYVGNYKRIVIVYGISLEEFRKRAGL